MRDFFFSLFITPQVSFHVTIVEPTQQQQKLARRRQNKNGPIELIDINIECTNCALISFANLILLHKRFRSAQIYYLMICVIDFYERFELPSGSLNFFFSSSI